jgi:small subunit ribosomal protein S20
MANKKSAEKRVRQTKVRTERNRALKTRVKNARKDALAALKSGDRKQITAAFAVFASAADKASNGMVIHKNTANRLKRRLNAALTTATAAK